MYALDLLSLFLRTELWFHPRGSTITVNEATEGSGADLLCDGFQMRRRVCVGCEESCWKMKSEDRGQKKREWRATATVEKDCPSVVGTTSTTLRARNRLCTTARSMHTTRLVSISILLCIHTSSYYIIYVVQYYQPVCILAITVVVLSSKYNKIHERMQ